MNISQNIWFGELKFLSFKKSFIWDPIFAKIIKYFCHIHCYMTVYCLTSTQFLNYGVHVKSFYKARFLWWVGHLPFHQDNLKGTEGSHWWMLYILFSLLYRYVPVFLFLQTSVIEMVKAFVLFREGRMRRT